MTDPRPTKRITACFYRTPAGNEPVRDWLFGLTIEDRRIVGGDIATVEFGWPVGMPVCDAVGRGIREVRSTIKRGKVEARVYFGIDGDRLVMLHGAEKKPARQQDDIAIAEQRWTDYKRRKE